MYVEKQKELHPKERAYKLQSLSDTRWSSRFRATKAVIKSLSAIIECLEDIEQMGSHDVDTAKGLLRSIQSKKFVFFLVMFNGLLTNALSESLQSTQVDLGQAVRVIVAVKDTLRDKRSEKAFDELWKVFAKQWEELEVIDIEEELSRLSRPRRERRLPASLQGSIVDTTIGQRENLYKDLVTIVVICTSLC